MSSCTSSQRGCGRSRQPRYAVGICARAERPSGSRLWIAGGCKVRGGSGRSAPSQQVRIQPGNEDQGARTNPSIMFMVSSSAKRYIRTDGRVAQGSLKPWIVHGGSHGLTGGTARKGESVHCMITELFVVTVVELGSRDRLKELRSDFARRSYDVAEYARPDQEHQRRPRRTMQQLPWAI
jgi:hypothetical protein